MRTGAKGRVALGFRAHSGWAVLVAMRDPATAPVVVQRRRLELADRRITGALQPYHAAQKMPLTEAEEFLHECDQNASSLATKALRAALVDLASRNYQVAGACLLLASGRTSSDLASTLASHAMIHTAEGEFYRSAIRRACESCGIAVTGVKEKAVRTDAAAKLGIRVEQLDKYTLELGKAIGPPWRQDEKLSAMGAWIMLTKPLAAASAKPL